MTDSEFDELDRRWHALFHMLVEWRRPIFEVQQRASPATIRTLANQFDFLLSNLELHYPTRDKNYAVYSGEYDRIGEIFVRFRTQCFILNIQPQFL